MSKRLLSHGLPLDIFCALGLRFVRPRAIGNERKHGGGRQGRTSYRSGGRKVINVLLILGNIDYGVGGRSKKAQWRGGDGTPLPTFFV